MVKVKSILRLHHYKLSHEAKFTRTSTDCSSGSQIEANSFYRICHIHDVERKSLRIFMLHFNGF